MTDISNLKILVAEDNPINQRVASLTLRQMGYSCDIASTGLEAVERYQQIYHSIIFMDLQMPEMDGMEAAKRIREYEKEMNIKNPVFIVAITANTTDEKKQICIDSGMDDFIEKPIMEKSFRDMILKVE